MSKTKYSKFNDSGNMLPFYLASIIVGVDQIQKVLTLMFSFDWKEDFVCLFFC